ncbi:PREDICTED: WPP domain-containing protein 1 [Camelina sativa]|uniref:WPP domain-containing protein 1 n=1 Tax=Camelina sativa TaxID=90675 RepID=A0ABM0X7L0_CAMSA|nr:PREDICTED: WPP domain-containing protein 1 [Camelina sativa]
MAAEADTTTTSPPQIPESENSTTLPTTEKKESNNETEKNPNPNPGTISLRIWPPTQKTRDAVVKRLTETLSTESILSKRYGTLDSEEASSVAKSIEDEAHAVASAAVVGDDDGIEILKVYSKEISKRMLESMKAKKTPAPKAGGGDEEEEETELAAELGSVKLDEDKA